MKRLIVGLVLALSASLPAWAQKSVTFAYQDMMNPFRWVQQTGEIETATGYTINWRQFGGGGDVIRAMASGDVAIGEAGSAPIATAISQGLEVELFWILEDIAGAEALVARNGSNVNSVADLKGKKVGVPFVSTTHFHLLYAMELAGVKKNDVQVLNMRPPEIAAAWERGDIGALAAMLTDEATIAMPPMPTWYRGREAVAAFLARFPLAPGLRWRVVPARASGQLAFGFYLWNDEQRGFLAHSVNVLTLDGARIADLTAFITPEAFGRFGLPGETRSQLPR